MKASSNLAVAFLAACSAGAAADRYEATEPHMGTLVSITLYADSRDEAQRAFSAAFGRIAQLDRILSDYNPASELSRVCQLNAPVSDELRTVVEHAQKLSVESDGAFDITVGPLSRLWRAARREKRLPAERDIEEALQRSGYRKFRIENGRARCGVRDMQLDAGGIGKGYAADEAIAVLAKAGVTRALVAVSGDIAAGDAPPDKKGWKVNVLDRTINLVYGAVSTSGDEFQFLEVDGVRYSHIFDPRTGMALKNSHVVAVIARRGIEADSLTKAIAIGGQPMAERLSKTYHFQALIH